ncbi:hypothetical protein PRVXH_001950 [Proteinivorax hydrogeniformans]|uniref:Uncharacterized protein n=1 Tax=Proteinivorax hydrogeniformans TaxID=1826727 RepID=A0AAU8HS30_9FIRM
MSKEFDLEGVIKSVTQCCLGCSSCSNSKCLVGYDKKIINKAILSQEEFVDGGIDGLNMIDTKIYDEDEMIDAIGFLLNQCKNCKLYHDEDCIINVIRASLELALLGDYVDYEGSVLMYLNSIKGFDDKKAKKISEAYNIRRKK